MTTKISVITGEKTAPFSSLPSGEKFMYAGNKMSGNVYMKISNLYEIKGDSYLKNAVNLSTGKYLEIPKDENVVVVDLEIKAIK